MALYTSYDQRAQRYGLAEGAPTAGQFFQVGVKPLQVLADFGMAGQLVCAYCLSDYLGDVGGGYPQGDV